jgi:hypothetical protein
MARRLKYKNKFTFNPDTIGARQSCYVTREIQFEDNYTRSRDVVLKRQRQNKLRLYFRTTPSKIVVVGRGVFTAPFFLNFWH